MLLEIGPHRSEYLCKRVRSALLEILRVQLPIRVCRRELCEGLELHRAAVLRWSVDLDRAQPREHDQLDDIHDWVSLDFRGTERVLDLLRDFLRGIVQVYSARRLAL